MSILQALILGLVQGATEFLPVSSSGHLVLVPFVFGWPIPSVAFDVAVHLGTLAAVAWSFRAEIAQIVRTILGWRQATPAQQRLVRLIAIGTVPAALFGIAARSRITGTFERPVLVSLLLGVTAWLMWNAETKAESIAGARRGAEDIDMPDAITIGVAQAAAIFPGISRSGSTVAAGLYRGLDRESAARFSFLLAIPAILGAAVVSLPDLADSGVKAGSLIVGVLTSAVTGVLAIRWFLGLVRKRGLRVFSVYLYLAMVAGLLTALARG